MKSSCCGANASQMVGGKMMCDGCGKFCEVDDTPKFTSRPIGEEKEEISNDLARVFFTKIVVAVAVIMTIVLICFAAWAYTQVNLFVGCEKHLEGVENVLIQTK